MYEPIARNSNRVLITGAAGFGGSGLALALLERGYHVTGLDEIAPANADLLCHAFTRYADRFNYIWKNLLDIRKDDIEGHQIVIHIAAQADVPMGFTSPKYTTMQNVQSTVALLEEIRRIEGIEKFLYAASGNEIGRYKSLPIDETHSLTPHNPYSWSKAAAEMAVWSWSRTYKIPVVILSNGVVIGPNMRREIFIFKWLWNAYHSIPIVVEGGDQTRDVTYIDDVINAWLLVIEAPSDQVVGHKFQISFGKEISIKELANMCLEITGSKVPIKFVGYRPGEQGQRECFTIEKAKRILGYSPAIPPEKAIKLTADWVKTLLK